ncbi:hypothetical protein ASA1KI_00690 [Opitutales bacterium ASA1]|uniref:hypothetical protein n=1 Tax=Congregicoccus parvus TaxID=3081749 RepID=UPI002B31345F|nr:hypothetical protein ASA1KI_00690 [Opitutales bacterium ASA1]
MTPSSALRSLVASCACLAFAAPLALAHPGHDHADIPSVIRKPFAGPEHVVVTVVVVATLAFAAFALVRRLRRETRKHRE